ncbi:MAG: helix-turn-helix domain-containing protein [Vulcanimicrobiaceae bacterium]
METLEAPSVVHGPGHCPIQDAISSIADKWKLLILMELSREGVLRFKELQRHLGTVSQKVLTSALRDLEADGLVNRRVFAEVPPRVEYRATEAVHSLLPILEQLNTWATARAKNGSSTNGTTGAG